MRLRFQSRSAVVPERRDDDDGSAENDAFEKKSLGKKKLEWGLEQLDELNQLMEVFFLFIFFISSKSYEHW